MPLVLLLTCTISTASRGFGFAAISWCIACSNSLLFRIARTFPLLLLAQYGVTISTLDWHTSSFPPFSPPAVLPGKSAWRLCLSEDVSFPTADLLSVRNWSTSSTHQMFLQVHPVETWSLV